VSPTLPVDWERAARWAGRLAPPGPVAPRRELERLVADLRLAAERALPLAERAARLGAALDAAGRGVPEAQVLVVDRPGWAVAATGSFRALAGRGGAAPAADVPTGTSTGISTGQLAGALAMLSTRVLGQFDPFGGRRLLLVAPNVREIGAAMHADPAEFALWVCVHEQTHALQFAAAPWLADHLRSEVHGLVDALARTPAEELAAVARGVARVLRGERAPDDGLGPVGLLLEPEQRRRLAGLTATMALLEGHADVAMDAVPRREIPSARRLRARMDARRSAGGMQAVLRRVLGLDAKLAQYRTGAAFVREVRRAAVDALDVVWTSPEALPSAADIAAPAAWLRRVRP
jgi:coenzyme F420 biosynthesis associated uncharacterized protein